MTSIILGSSSPRRAQILQFFSIPFTQIASQFDEDSAIYEGNPYSYVDSLSLAKAKALVKNHEDHLILTADTAVFYENQVYNKPKNLKEAVTFLETFSGNCHSVISSLTLYSKGSFFTKNQETKVTFHTLQPHEIDTYLNHIEYLDKAGGYAIQGNGMLLVQKIEGCYYNVMGLPINSLKELLLNANINLWDFL